jgi:hypothetical protein
MPTTTQPTRSARRGAPVPRRQRPTLARLLKVATVVALSGATLACTTRIHPPTPLADPAIVVLVDHGNTPGLALPGAADAAVYVYGDWNWYALRNTGIGDGLAALAWPTQGALGRRIYPAPLESAATMQALRLGAQQIHEVRVPRARAEALRRRLDEQFEAQRATRVYTASLDLEFVHHPRPYTLFSNSNHQVRDWLVELGCDAQGPAFLSRWEIATPPAAR